MYGLGNGNQHGRSQGKNAQSGISDGNTSNGNGNTSNGNGNTSNGSRLNGSSVYGKTQVNHLLSTLFPHRQALNGATSEDKP
jgi:carbon dioxide concentrating mechanism protein CcmN